MTEAKYLYIAGEIKRRVVEHIYDHGAPLPDQFELAAEFNASRMTIQKAIHKLIIEGVVFTRKGQGTFVKRNFAKIAQHNLQRHFYGATSSWGGEVTSKILAFDVRFPSVGEKDDLALDDYQSIYDFRRLRLLNGTPVSIDHTLMPMALIPGLNEEILNKSIFNYVENDLGLKISGSYRVAKALKADEYDVKYLHCDKNDPVLEVEQIVYLDSGVPLEYARSHFCRDFGGFVIVDY